MSYVEKNAAAVKRMFFFKKGAESFDSMLTSWSASNNDTSDALVNASKGASFDESLH